MSQRTSRAPFSEDLKSLRALLPTLIPVLEADPSWYGSIHFERRGSRNFMANLKASNISNQINQGIVLRIYNGYTLFEQASDDLNADSLRKTARAFAERVAKTPAPAGATPRPYKAPTWNERLSAQLDDEIVSQIPRGVRAQDPVHFGIRYRRDPRELTSEQQISRLKDILTRVERLAPANGMPFSEITFAMARQALWQEESIFVDRETDMSQTLLRMALTVVLMSGADRIFSRLGGLGGIEASEVSDDELAHIIRELHALKSAERLNPGKYRVLVGPVVSGVIAHEAFGHAQEGDTCARGRSKAWDLHHSGETVGNEHATILNNPAVFTNADEECAAWGSYFFDEEGWLASEQVLLDRGKLKAPMTNLTSAIRLGVPRTANGKRENWSQGVYTRQTNTYFSPGDKTLEQLMRQLGDGFLATEPAGGMEDPKGMGIQVGLQYLKEVKGGKLTGRVFKGPAGGDIQLTGYTPDVLNSIVDKSKIEFESDRPDQAKYPFNDAGGCGKYHKEFVFAGCGGPYMLLDPVILG